MLLSIVVAASAFTAPLTPRHTHMRVVMADKYDIGASWGNSFMKSTTGKYDRVQQAKMLDLPAWYDVEECIVDAENAEEIAMCKDFTEPTPRAPTAPDPMGEFMAGFSRLFNKPNVQINVEECIVDAENAAEIAACRA